MRWIPTNFHRILDLTTVTVFALVPSLFGLAGFSAILSYTLAIVHLAMTLLTRFSPAARHPVSLKLHGAVELIVGIILVSLPWLVGWNGSSRIFFMSAGATILLVWAFSRYGTEASRAGA